jgi:hypothetical protein
MPRDSHRVASCPAASRRPKRNISATIVAYVKRFSHQINTDEVFGTHRPKIDRAMRDLIRWMSKENPKLGASRIHGELLMLGFEVAQSTVSKYMMRGGRHLRKPGKRFFETTHRRSPPLICAWFPR